MAQSHLVSGTGALEWLLGSGVGVAQVVLFWLGSWDWLGAVGVSRLDGGAEPTFTDGMATTGKVIEHYSEMVDEVARGREV